MSPVVVEHWLQHSGDECRWHLYWGDNNFEKITKKKVIESYGRKFKTIIRSEIKIAHAIIRLYREGRLSGDPLECRIKVSYSKGHEKDNYPYTVEVDHDPLGLSTALPAYKNAKITPDGKVIIKHWGYGGYIIFAIKDGNVISERRCDEATKKAESYVV
jgi:hypothetical protein